MRRRATGQTHLDAVPPIVSQVLRSTGQPLEPNVRAVMESCFGHDFSAVRVHRDARAQRSAETVNALAYTVGPNIAFNRGQYSPGNEKGRTLLAHELAHVVQQRGSAPALMSRLKIGPPRDSAETEADRAADAVMARSSDRDPVALPISSRSPAMLRRAPTTPQRVGRRNERLVSLPAEQRGEEQVRVHVFRYFLACPCRRVNFSQSGIFYNPELNNLAIAYRYCSGAATTDIYGQLQSNAQSFLSGTAPPAGTARVGIDVNLWGRTSGGRIIVEAIGANEGSGEGVGGHAQIVYQGGTWRVFLDTTFIRRLRELPGGTTPNELQISLGGQIGNLTVRLDAVDLLQESARGGRLTGCYPVSGGVELCPYLEAGSGRGLGVGLGVRGSLSIPEVRQERCRQCFCPPPVRKYECIEDTLPRDVPVRERVGVQNEYRYYFKLDTINPSEDAGLRTQSNTNLANLAGEVRSGNSVTMIAGYASPEASERHNSGLSERRARKMRDLVRTQVGASVQLPEPFGGGELLGRRLTASPSSRMSEVITRSGFRSAEDLSMFLFGDEIPNSELAQQFVSLLTALPANADRLALFGLTDQDPIAADVLDAINRFLRRGGRGYRPWERIFRLLRTGLAKVAHFEMRTTGTRRTSGDLHNLSESECAAYARRAEQTGEFGPVDPSALRPTTSSEDSNDDCLIEPQQEEIDQGCQYSLPAGSRGRLSAPDIAPRQLR